MCLQVQSAARGVMPVVDSCLFVRNHAQRAGGAMDVRSVTGDLLAHGTVMHSNTACSAGGAVALTSVAKVVLQRCLIWNNSALVQDCQRSAPGVLSRGHGGGISHVCTWLV